MSDAMPKKYLALEIFARNLTAGWWSWGDEVLEYQKKKYWIEPQEHTDKVDELPDR